MSDHLMRYLPVLTEISKIKLKEDRQQVLRIFAKDKDFVKAIKEIAYNTVNGNIVLSDAEKLSLRRHKNTLIKLSSKGGKKDIIQSGTGFLSLLLPIVSTVLGSMLNGSK